MSPKSLVDKYFQEKEKQENRPKWFVTVVDHGDFETVHVTHSTKFRYPRPNHVIFAGSDFRRAFALCRTYTQARFRASESVIFPDRHGEATNACEIRLLGGLYEVMWFKTAQLRDKYQENRKKFWEKLHESRQG